MFPGERMTPTSKQDCWNRNVKPKLKSVGMGWANFLVMRRTHATLMNELGVNVKLEHSPYTAIRRIHASAVVIGIKRRVESRFLLHL